MDAFLLDEAALLATQQLIVSTRRQDHSAAKDATARHATQDEADLGANLFMYCTHAMFDEVELFFCQVLWDLFPHPTPLFIPCV